MSIAIFNISFLGRLNEHISNLWLLVVVVVADRS